MRSLPAAVLLAATCLVARPGFTQPTAQPAPVAKVAVNFKDVPLRQAIGRLLQGTGADFVVEPDVPDIPIRLHFTSPVEFETALRAVAHLAGAEFVLRSGLYIVGFLDPDEKKLTVDLKEVPFRQALRQVFEGSGQQFAVDPDVPDVPITVSMRDVDLSSAIRVLVRLAGATYRKDTNVYRIQNETPPAAPAGFKTRLMSPLRGAPLLPELAAQKVTASFDHLAFRRAVALLFGGTPFKYRVEMDVPDDPVSLNVKAIPLSTALDTLTRLSRTTCMREGDTYVFRRPR